MTQMPLTDAEISYLKGRLSVYDYAGGYQYLYDVVQNAIPNQTDQNERDQLLMTANWLISAKSINNHDGTFVSEMVLNSMKYAVEQSGRNFTGAMFQNASNELARNVITDFIDAKGVLPIQQVIERDVQSAVQKLGLQPWQWGGTLGDVFPTWMGGLGENFVEVPGDTFLEGMNNWATVIVQNLAAVGMIFENHLGNASMILPIAAKKLFGDLLIGDEEINISLPVIPGGGVGDGGGSGGPGGVTSGSNDYGTGGGIPVTNGEKPAANVDIFFESVGGLEYVSPEQIARMKCKLDGKVDPLILDLDGSGVKLTSAHVFPVQFDMNNDGQKVQTGWSSIKEGIVVLDLNKNGKIDDISELMSEYFGAVQGSNESPSEKTFENAFYALRSLDSNQDLIFDSQDEQWKDVKVWIDANHDGQSFIDGTHEFQEVSELYSLDELGISQIDLRFISPLVDTRNGNDIVGVSSFTQKDIVKEAVAVNFSTVISAEPPTVTMPGLAYTNNDLWVA
ncbi:hypothetical protein JFV30_14545 [Pseudomonas sp. TH32]|uniref:hypothetical protein n=1 Tax=Pseudomonas sp. TH32 TaxID=2796397 RepID=UPI001911B742|nr:hypothetical protein [Pseudomonas sp. TH32]MBK5437993.1 hypothetical protein [Pseudomonas sp. TH32]